MRVNSNLFQSSSLFLKAGSSKINRAADRADQTAGSRNQTRDQATISPQGKLMSMIQQLSDQKKSISQRKHDLIGRTLEAGGDIKTIQSQLDTLDEQVTQIDEQIAQMTADFAKKAAEQAVQKKEKEEKEDETKTKEQVDTVRLTNLATATDKLGHAQDVAAVQRKVEGSANILENEADMGSLEVHRLEDKGALYAAKVKLESMANEGISAAGIEATRKAENAPRALNSGPNLEQVISRLRQEVSDTHAEADDLLSLAQDMALSQGEQLREANEKAEDKRDPDKAEDNADNEAVPAGEPESIA